MRRETTDSVGRFYSRRARYPLHTLEPGCIGVSEPTDPATPTGRWVLWMAVLPDRAVLVSPNEFAPSLREAVKGRAPDDLMRPDSLADLSARCAAIAGHGTALQPYTGRKYCCDAGMLHPVHDANVRRLTPENASTAIRRLGSVGIPDDPAYLLAEHAAFAYFLNGEPVAFAGTHPAGDFSDRVGDVMLGTLEAHRRRGFGRAVISATTEAVVAGGKVAVCGMLHDNLAAMRTAVSVGYQQYCEVFEVRRAT